MADRYVRVGLITFQDLVRAFGIEGRHVFAVEVDNQRGVLHVVHAAVTPVAEGSMPSQVKLRPVSHAVD